MTRARILIGFQYGTQWLSAGVEVSAPDESTAGWFEAGLAERVAQVDAPVDAPAVSVRRKKDGA